MGRVSLRKKERRPPGRRLCGLSPTASRLYARSGSRFHSFCSRLGGGFMPDLLITTHCLPPPSPAAPQDYPLSRDFPDHHWFTTIVSHVANMLPCLGRLSKPRSAA